ncbi:MAG: hypothetical protein JWN42_1804 [Candidatus Angelobacter sp.]|nr:hypothetical protein [Candidatus Angelobacter sp.]
MGGGVGLTSGHGVIGTRGKNPPLIYTDDTDRNRNTAEGGCATRAIPGVELCKPFGILVGVWGEGWGFISGDMEIG